MFLDEPNDALGFAGAACIAEVGRELQGGRYETASGSHAALLESKVGSLKLFCARTIGAPTTLTAEHCTQWCPKPSYRLQEGLKQTPSGLAR